MGLRLLRYCRRGDKETYTNGNFSTISERLDCRLIYPEIMKMETFCFSSELFFRFHGHKKFTAERNEIFLLLLPRFGVKMFSGDAERGTEWKRKESSENDECLCTMMRVSGSARHTRPDWKKKCQADEGAGARKTFSAAKKNSRWMREKLRRVKSVMYELRNFRGTSFFYDESSIFLWFYFTLLPLSRGKIARGLIDTDSLVVSLTKFRAITPWKSFPR